MTAKTRSVLATARPFESFMGTDFGVLRLNFASHFSSPSFLRIAKVSLKIIGMPRVVARITAMISGIF